MDYYIKVQGRILLTAVALWIAISTLIQAVKNPELTSTELITAMPDSFVGNWNVQNRTKMKKTFVIRCLETKRYYSGELCSVEYQWVRFASGAKHFNCIRDAEKVLSGEGLKEFESRLQYDYAEIRTVYKSID